MENTTANYKEISPENAKLIINAINQELGLEGCRRLMDNAILTIAELMGRNEFDPMELSAEPSHVVFFLGKLRDVLLKAEINELLITSNQK